MEDEDGEHEAEPVLWPIRYGLAMPYMTDKYRTGGEIDLGLRGGFLLANRFRKTQDEEDHTKEDEIQVLARATSTYARAIAQEADETLRDEPALGASLRNLEILSIA